eukprot:756749-Hanusia_phi.AAC.2
MSLLVLHHSSPSPPCPPVGLQMISEALPSSPPLLLLPPCCSCIQSVAASSFTSHHLAQQRERAGDKNAAALDRSLQGAEDSSRRALPLVLHVALQAHRLLLGDADDGDGDVTVVAGNVLQDRILCCSSLKTEDNCQLVRKER